VNWTRDEPSVPATLTETVSPQDLVTVESFFESPGTLHASSIIDVQSQRSIVDTPPSSRYRGPPRPGTVARQPLSASGTTRVLTHGKRGEGQRCGTLRWHSCALAATGRDAILQDSGHYKASLLAAHGGTLRCVKGCVGARFEIRLPRHELSCRSLNSESADLLTFE
jgi:hypothetical protein